MRKFKLKQIVMKKREKKYIFVIMRSNIIKIKDYFPQKKTVAESTKDY